MGFCTPDEHQGFLRSCPEFERMLVRSGTVLLKYWFSVSYEEQTKRFEARNAEPLKRWKLSDMDLAEQELYVKYSMARAARLNCISHLLSQFPYENVAPEPVELPGMRDIAYVRPPMHEQTFVPGCSDGSSTSSMSTCQVCSRTLGVPPGS